MGDVLSGRAISESNIQCTCLRRFYAPGNDLHEQRIEVRLPSFVVIPGLYVPRFVCIFPTILVLNEVFYAVMLEIGNKNIKIYHTFYYTFLITIQHYRGDTIGSERQ